MDRNDELIETFKSKLTDFDQFMNAAATKQEIDYLEQKVEQSLPASYLKLLANFNGEKEILNTMGGLSFLSIAQVELQWTLFSASDRTIKPHAIFQEKKIQPLLYHRNRIPFAHDGSGNFLCIDYYPDVRGEIGQIIYLPCGKSEPVSVIFTNFDNYIDFLIDSLRSSRLSFVDERVNWNPEDWHMAEIYFHKNWDDNWLEIAEEFNQMN